MISDELGTISRASIVLGNFISSSSSQDVAKASFITSRRVARNSPLVEDPLSRTALAVPKASKRSSRENVMGAEGGHSVFEVTWKPSEGEPIRVCTLLAAVGFMIKQRAKTNRSIVEVAFRQEPRKLFRDDRHSIVRGGFLFLIKLWTTEEQMIRSMVIRSVVK